MRKSCYETLAIAVLLWAACGALAFGILNGEDRFQHNAEARRYTRNALVYDRPESSFRHAAGENLIISLSGPCALVVSLLLSSCAEHGLNYSGAGWED